MEAYTTMFDHIPKPPTFYCSGCNLVTTDYNELEFELIERIQFLNKRIENIMNVVEKETDRKTYSKIEEKLNTFKN